MKLLLITFVVASFFVFEKEKQNNENDYILWSEDRKLTWEDFMGEPDEKSNFKANTYTNLGYNLVSYNSDTAVYEITTRFNKLKSWTKSKGTDLLKHEQIHFDISELIMRKLRKYFLEYNLQTYATFNADLDKKYNVLIEESNRLNEKYDKETNHGTIKKKQEEWEKKIQKELDGLKEYSKTRVTIVKNKTISPTIKTNKNSNKT